MKYLFNSTKVLVLLTLLLILSAYINNMKILDFPISEIFEQDGTQMVRSYIPVRIR